jgi:parvulin-like peptidyl-prolyl isomerase
MIGRAQFLKEPLLHFLVIGAALFGVYAWLNRDGNNAGLQQVHLAESDVRWLKDTFAQERQRDPTDEELRGLVRDFVKETLLARQAQELGLDKDDIVVRRRLAQKMTFLLQDDSRHATPSDDDLHRLYEAQRNQAQNGQIQGSQIQSSQVQSGQTQSGARALLTRPRISFKQIFFSRDQRADAAADARQALQELSPPDDAERAAAMGDRASIKSEFRNADQRAVANQFGAKFAARVFELEPGGWQGPIESSQGVHLVRITERTAAQLRPFDEIRDQLVEMWQEQNQRESEERYFVGLLKKYRVVPDEPVKAVVGAALGGQSDAPKGISR